MRTSRWATYAVGVVAAAALIAGCSGNGGGTATQPPTGVTPNSMSPSGHGNGGILPFHRGPQDTFIGAMPMGKAHSDHHKSWVLPAAKDAPRLMFASDDSSNDVYIFLLPSMKLLGTLTGFSEPQGICADTGGNMYIVNTNDKNVLKYSRTGTLLATYTDSFGYPVGCAVDPMTGDLAVTDIFDGNGSVSGDVLVFTSPSATPTELRNSSQYYYYFAGYDGSGHLWVDGKSTAGTFILSGCSSSSCSTILTSGGTIYFPGAVQWDKTQATWVVFDQLCGDTNAACSYPVSASGVLGAKTTYTNYSGTAVCDLIQGVIAADHHKYVGGGDYDPCGFATSTYDRWAYPAGGDPEDDITNSNYFPVGAAVSTK